MRCTGGCFFLPLETSVLLKTYINGAADVRIHLMLYNVLKKYFEI